MIYRDGNVNVRDDKLACKLIISFALRGSIIFPFHSTVCAWAVFLRRFAATIWPRDAALQLLRTRRFPEMENCCQEVRWRNRGSVQGKAINPVIWRVAGWKMLYLRYSYKIIRQAVSVGHRA